jgi:hypothetical protein
VDNEVTESGESSSMPERLKSPRQGRPLSPRAPQLSRITISPKSPRQQQQQQQQEQEPGRALSNLKLNEVAQMIRRRGLSQSGVARPRASSASKPDVRSETRQTRTNSQGPLQDLSPRCMRVRTGSIRRERADSVFDAEPPHLDALQSLREMAEEITLTSMPGFVSLDEPSHLDALQSLREMAEEITLTSLPGFVSLDEPLLVTLSETESGDETLTAKPTTTTTTVVTVSENATPAPLDADQKSLSPQRENSDAKPPERHTDLLRIISEMDERSDITVEEVDAAINMLLRDMALEESVRGAVPIIEEEEEKEGIIAFRDGVLATCLPGSYMNPHICMLCEVHLKPTLQTYAAIVINERRPVYRGIERCPIYRRIEFCRTCYERCDRDAIVPLPESSVSLFYAL